MDIRSIICCEYNILELQQRLPEVALIIQTVYNRGVHHTFNYTFSAFTTVF